MSRVKMWVVIFMVFVLGTLAGSLGMQQYMHHKISDFFRGNEQARVEKLLARMSRDFDLTDSQQVEVRNILQESHNLIQEIKTQTDPRIRTIIDESLLRIREKLNDSQKKRFDDIHERIKKRGDHPPPF